MWEPQPDAMLGVPFCSGRMEMMCPHTSWSFWKLKAAIHGKRSGCQGMVNTHSVNMSSFNIHKTRPLCVLHKLSMAPHLPYPGQRGPETGPSVPTWTPTLHRTAQGNMPGCSFCPPHQEPGTHVSPPLRMASQLCQHLTSTHSKDPARAPPQQGAPASFLSSPGTTKSHQMCD